MSVEGLDDWFSIIETAQKASESITPIVHEAIVNEFRRRRSSIPISDVDPSRPSHVPGALMKSLTNPSDRLHYFWMHYSAGAIRIEVGSHYRGARFQIRRIPKPVVRRVHDAVFKAYETAIKQGHLPREMDVKSVRNKKYRRDRNPFGRRKYTRLTRRTRT